MQKMPSWIRGLLGCIIFPSGQRRASRDSAVVEGTCKSLMSTDSVSEVVREEEQAEVAWWKWMRGGKNVCSVLTALTGLHSVLCSDHSRYHPTGGSKHMFA